MAKCKVIAVSNFKGGCGKTMTAASLGIGLAQQGKRVLLLDVDSQHSLSVSFGIKESDNLAVTLTDVMERIVSESDFDPTAGIIHQSEGVDILPSNSTLTKTEISLSGVIGREMVLKLYVDRIRHLYDYIIEDCAPTYNLLTINALAAADEVIIPVVPKFLDAKGLELLLKSIAQIRRQINPSLEIGGILLTMVDRRANFTREVISLIESAYGGKIRIFGESVPHSVRAAESTAQGVSIFTHDPKGKVAAAYGALVEEVLRYAA